jgi:hypothetical protein
MFHKIITSIYGAGKKKWEITAGVGIGDQKGVATTAGAGWSF